MTSDFALEVAKYPPQKNLPKHQNFGRVRTYCFALLAMQLVSIAMSMSVVCLSARITRKPRDRTSPKFLCKSYVDHSSVLLYY